MPNQIIQSHGGQLCKDHFDTTFAKSLYHQVRTPYLSNLELTISDDRLREYRLNDGHVYCSILETSNMERLTGGVLRYCWSFEEEDKNM